MGNFQLHRWKPESEQESDSQMRKISGSGFGPGFKNFGTGAESESEKWTPTSSGTNHVSPNGCVLDKIIVQFICNWFSCKGVNLKFHSYVDSGTKQSLIFTQADAPHTNVQSISVRTSDKKSGNLLTRWCSLLWQHADAKMAAEDKAAAKQRYPPMKGTSLAKAHCANFYSIFIFKHCTAFVASQSFYPSIRCWNFRRI